MPRLSPVVVDRRLDEDEENSSSFGTEDGDSSLISDCESVTSGSRIVEQHTSVRRNGLVRLDESDEMFGFIAKKFVSSGLIDAKVECINKNMFNAGAIAQARAVSFQIYTKSVGKKNGGDANVKHGWFGGSKDEIERIILHRFGFDDFQKKNACFGHGIVLSADHSPIDSVESATADENGIKHILLCRVLLGKSELVNRGSTQCYPSSDDFQSGVDNLLSPKKLVIWSSQMNTHILPEFVISFKTLTSMSSYNSDGVRRKKPVSPWIPIPNLIAALSKILAPKAIKEIAQFRHSYIEHKICRHDMIRGIREVTGDRVLLMVLKDFTQQRRFTRLS